MESIGSIAFVGLGHMGEPMAARLVSCGFRVHVHDSREGAAVAFVDRYGGTATKSLPDALHEVDAVITMLPTGADVRKVMLGADGVAEHFSHGGIAIDMSTSKPESTVTIAKALAAKGICYVDAPVMGGVAFALNGTLEIMVGGDAATLARCDTVFAALGRKTWRCGDTGTGHAMKAIANFANAATLITFLESMVIGRKFGLDTQFQIEVLTAMCTGRQHPLVKKIIPHVATRKFASRMSLGLMAKDVEIFADLAQQVDAKADIAVSTRSIWNDAVRRYGPVVDHTRVVQLWEEAAGVMLE